MNSRKQNKHEIIFAEIYVQASLASVNCGHIMDMSHMAGDMLTFDMNDI